MTEAGFLAIALLNGCQIALLRMRNSSTKLPNTVFIMMHQEVSAVLLLGYPAHKVPWLNKVGQENYHYNESLFAIL